MFTKKTPNIYCWQQSVKVINHTSDAGLCEWLQTSTAGFVPQYFGLMTPVNIKNTDLSCIKSVFSI